MYSLKYFHLPHHRLFKKDILFFSVFLRTLIFVSFFTFLPGIIFEHFLFLGEKKAMFVVCLFFFLYSFVNLIFLFLLPFFYKKYGVKFGLFLSVLFTFLMLFFLEKEFFIFAGYIYGFVSSFWWVSYYILFLYLQKSKNLGNSLGLQELFIGIASSFSPLISSFLLEKNLLLYYLFIFLLLVVVLFFVFKLPRYKIKVNVDFKLIFEEIKNNKKDFLGFVVAGVEGMIFSVFWPLYLYFIFRDFIKLGGFMFLIGVFTAFLNYFLGKFLDQFKKEGSIEKVGVLALNFSWLGKTVFQNPFLYAFLDVVRYVFYPFFYLPLNKLAFQHAKTDVISHYVIFREFSFKIGNLLAIFFAVILLALDLPFIFLFLFAGFFTLFILFF